MTKMMLMRESAFAFDLKICGIYRLSVVISEIGLIPRPPEADFCRTTGCSVQGQSAKPILCSIAPCFPNPVLIQIAESVSDAAPRASASPRLPKNRVRAHPDFIAKLT
jgi:hypothetical protein